MKEEKHKKNNKDKKHKHEQKLEPEVREALDSLKSVEEVAEPAKKAKKIKKKFFFRELTKLQIELNKLQEWIRKEGLKVVIIFEGRDAAGKGGAMACYNRNRAHNPLSYGVARSCLK